MENDAQKLLLAEIQDHVGLITINRPEKRNAMTLSMWQRLGDVLEDWAKKSDLRTVIIRGAGEVSFCAGNDIKEYATIRATAEQRVGYDEITTRAYDLLRTFPCPTIARVTGFSVGGGMELALLCDFQIAATSAEFGVTPARLGIGYKLADVQLLLDHVSPKDAKEILFTGDRFPAADALRWGLISRAVDAADLDQAVDALARKIASNAPLSIKQLKVTIHEAASGKPDLERCAELVRICDASSDRVEGQTAFAEKRQPNFKGK